MYSQTLSTSFERNSSIAEPVGQPVRELLRVFVRLVDKKTHNTQGTQPVLGDNATEQQQREIAARLAGERRAIGYADFNEAEALLSVLPRPESHRPSRQ